MSDFLHRPPRTIEQALADLEKRRPAPVVNLEAEREFRKLCRMMEGRDE